MQETVRVVVDLALLEKLRDYYHKDEMIPELEDVAVDTLLHVAAMCVAESSIVVSGGGEAYRSEERAKSALDVVRQLAVVYENKLCECDINEDEEVVIEGQPLLESE